MCIPRQRLLRQLTDIKNEVPDEDGIREIVDLWKNEDSGEIAPAWPEHWDLSLIHIYYPLSSM